MNRLIDSEDSEWTILRLLAIGAFVVIIIAGMRAATSIITTTFFAFIIAVSVTPLQNWLRRRGLPLWLSFTLVALAVVIFILFLVGILAVSVNHFVNALPQYRERIAELKAALTSWLGSYNIDLKDVLALDSFQPENMVDNLVGFMGQISQAMSTWVFIMVLAGFMLIESVDQPDKLLKAVSAKNRIPAQFISFNRDIRSYIAINAWIGFLCAIINTILLVMLGIDFALMWGVLSFLMSFIPMVGFIIALIPPAFMALLQFGVGRAIIVIIGFIIINTLTDNIIYPRLVGKGLNISPLVVIVAVFFWAWVLGPLGAILAVPITLMVKQLILESSDESRWLAVLMEPAHVDK